MTFVENAAGAAESVRNAIHGSYDADPTDVRQLYGAVGEASLLLDRTPQLLERLAVLLEQCSQSPSLDTDDGTTASGAEAAIAAAERLRAASILLDDLIRPDGERPVAAAHGLVSHLKIVGVAQ